MTRCALRKVQKIVVSGRNSSACFRRYRLLDTSQCSLLSIALAREEYDHIMADLQSSPAKREGAFLRHEKALADAIAVRQRLEEAK